MHEALPGSLPSPTHLVSLLFVCVAVPGYLVHLALVIRSRMREEQVDGPTALPLQRDEHHRDNEAVTL